MTVLFVLAAFLSAGLVFAVQPMAAKWLLPSLGGSPAVWITSMLFYQSALLAGYAYAHALGRVRDIRAQFGIHAALVLSVLAFLPLALGAGSADAVRNPTTWLVMTLSIGLGVPLVVLSATAPLMQRWYSVAGARDPYMLYAASNLGSLGALLAYPFAIEPWLPVHGSADALLPPSFSEPSQNLAWSLAFVAFVAVCLACGILMLGRSPRKLATPSSGSSPTGRNRAFWLLLAAVPSSAMLGTTLVITTDIAAVPLLWILPLAIYLTTFIVAFARPGTVPQRVLGWALAVCGLAVVTLRRVEYRPPPIPMIALSLLTLFFLAMLCHDRLSRARPHPERLTEFYLWIALGGAIGGLFNAVVAPALFDGVAEYPLVIVAAMLLRPENVPRYRGSTGRRRAALNRLLDVGLPLGFAVLMVAVTGAARDAWDSSQAALVTASIGAVLALTMVRRRIRFALCLAVLFVAAAIAADPAGRTLLAERTFFGVLRVVNAPGRPFRIVDDGGTSEEQTVDSHDLFHGTTRHGRQMQGLGMGRWGTSYYHPTGPIGKLFRAFRGTDRLHDVALIGLGVGALASYGESGQTMTFFEIDQEVVRIAGDPELFTFLEDSPAEIRTLVGDGRVLLSQEQDATFDLVVVDGFTSDAIPVHLLTTEAFETYLRTLRTDGLLALHITSEHFDLLPVIRGIAASLGIEGLWWDDQEVSTREEIEGKSRSVWAVLSRDAPALEPVRANGDWRPLSDAPMGRAWTDTLSSPLSVLK